PQACFDNCPVVRDDIEAGTGTACNRREWRLDKAGNGFLISVGKLTGGGVEAGNDRQAGPWRRDGEDVEVASIVLEAQYDLPDIAGVEPGVATAALRCLVERDGVVHQDDRARPAIALEVDEVLQRLFEQMQPIDEADAERTAAEQRPRPVEREERVTRL